MRSLPIAVLFFLSVSCVPLVAEAAELIPPVHPDEAKIIQRIIAVEGYSPVEAEYPKWRLNSTQKMLEELGVDADGLRGWQIEVKHDPRPHRGGFFSCVYNQQGRILALSGNGPWLRNDSLRLLNGMPELRSIRWDHNGFVANHPEVDLYDGSGFDSLHDSQLADIKIGLGFNDKGMEQAARIKNLRSFMVFHSRSTDAGIEFFEWHPNLRSFSVGEMASGRVTQQALASIATISNLTIIGFFEAVVPYQDGLSHLAPLKGRLKSIDLSMSVVSDADLQRLRAEHPEATITILSAPEIVKRHRYVAASLARQADGERAEQLKAAIAAAEAVSPE